MTAKNNEPADDVSNPIFDARQQYYRLWLHCSAMVKQSAMFGDHHGWTRALNLLFNHVYALLSKEEQSNIAQKFSEAQGKQNEFKLLNLRDPVFQQEYLRQKQDYEYKLFVIERDIYSAMHAHNMLLPLKSDDEFDIEEIIKKMGG